MQFSPPRKFEKINFLLPGVPKPVSERACICEPPPTLDIEKVGFLRLSVFALVNLTAGLAQRLACESPLPHIALLGHWAA